MMNRGTTLIEMLAALVLLAVIAVSTAEWLSAAAATTHSAQARISWVAAANSVLDAIACDLAVGDFDPAGETPGVACHAAVLVVQTRVVTDASVADERRWFRRGAQLHAEWAPLGSGHRAHALVLEDVTDWHCELSQDRRTLSVDIRGPLGQRASRRFSIR